MQHRLDLLAEPLQGHELHAPRIEQTLEKGRKEIFKAWMVATRHGIRILEEMFQHGRLMETNDVRLKERPQ